MTHPDTNTPASHPVSPAMLILYVDNPAASAGFYSGLLEREPLESSPTFAMFALDGGLQLGLWSRHTVQPAAQATGSGTEIAMVVANDQALLAWHEEWVRRGLAILQPPTRMGFGHTFMALDPDGHRLRVFVPGAG